MKTKSLCARTRLMLVVAAGGTLAMAPTVCRAGDPAAATPTTREAHVESTKSPKSCCSAAYAARKKHHATPEKVTLTGSLIPQAVKPKDANLVSTSPITVIDRKMIETSGSASLSGVLRKNVGGAR